MGAQSADGRQLALDGQIMSVSSGPPRRVRVTLTNVSGQALCIGRAAAGEAVLGLQLQVVGSAGRLPAPGGAGVAAGQAVRLQSLAPGQQLSLELDLDAWASGWVDDRYTLVLRYDPQTGGRAALNDEAAGLGCRFAHKRAVATVGEFGVSGAGGGATRNAYRDIWQQTSAPADQRWTALRWLARNAVGPGASREEVLALLGQPTERRDDRQWVYAVGQTGVRIEFRGNSVQRMDFFETSE
ncbi:MAG: hypothetical protein JNJ60_02850 [Rhodocyclaceae bacterium]|nr:hypothetical protein [Rhodocyclaceae bacterium]